MNTEQFDGHTPGPWKWEVRWEGECPWICIPDSEGKVDTDLCLLDGLLNNQDARLIAAAPELLAEVKQLREMLALWEICRECFITYNECTCGGDEE